MHLPLIGASEACFCTRQPCQAQVSKIALQMTLIRNFSWHMHVLIHRLHTMPAIMHLLTSSRPAELCQHKQPSPTTTTSVPDVTAPRHTFLSSGAFSGHRLHRTTHEQSLAWYTHHVTQICTQNGHETVKLISRRPPVGVLQLHVFIKISCRTKAYQKNFLNSGLLTTLQFLPGIMGGQAQT